MGNGMHRTHLFQTPEKLTGDFTVWFGTERAEIRFKMQKDGKPVGDQTTIDRLWVTTQREAMIESGPPAEKPAASNRPSEKAAPTTPK